jgi:hypothetical protein
VPACPKDVCVAALLRIIHSQDRNKARPHHEIRFCDWQNDAEAFPHWSTTLPPHIPSAAACPVERALFPSPPQSLCPAFELHSSDGKHDLAAVNRAQSLDQRGFALASIAEVKFSNYRGSICGVGRPHTTAMPLPARALNRAGAHSKEHGNPENGVVPIWEPDIGNGPDNIGND